MSNLSARLIYPHQLFSDHLKAETGTVMILIEDDLFFTQNPFHKQKIILHRASMRSFAATLQDHGFRVEVIETSNEPSMNVLKHTLSRLKPSDVSYYELTDDWLEQRLASVTVDLKLATSRLPSPGFLTSLGEIDDYFSTSPNRMQYFYEWQRKRLGILVEGDKPVGKKWSFDEANRKKLPKNISLPRAYPEITSNYISEAQTWVEDAFPDNPGRSVPFRYPITHKDAEARLEHFITERLATFGPYEDAIAANESELFHSVLSPLLNIGLVTPRHVVDEVLAYATDHEVPIESLEGFIRQIIGWREYMRATYIRFGRKMRSGNHLEYSRTLEPGWWNGSVGIEPIDTTIKRVLETGYAHHIERLMVLGNSMVLLRIHPDSVYEWFMSLFIDAYDWVMVPNVYAMSQFAAGEMITTKPYISGSNYLIKMSDYQKGEWSDIWDALYWTFIHDYRDMVERNYRMRMVVTLYDRFDDAKKDRMQSIARTWLAED